MKLRRCALKRFSGCLAAILSILSFCYLLIFSGCSTTNSEGFAIYLTADDVPPAEMINLSRFDLADKPVIATADIVSYQAATHEILLTSEAFERISSLEVPVRGKSFVVCVNREPIYWGAFWTPVSSMSFDGVTIWKPFGTQQFNSIKLELGYPSQTFYSGTDPRSNAEIMQSLGDSGKLIAMLPKSMKGYELYSWSQDGQWHFTLITGTNRNKTQDEIISRSNTVTADGWVQIQVIGEDAIKTILAAIPQDEWVLWLAGPIEPATTPEVIFTLPPETIIEALKTQAQQSDFHLAI
jgi:hypothetical protein